MSKHTKEHSKRDFIESISDIMKNSEFKKLSEFQQHLGTSRLIHSIHVSFIAWKMASFLGLDTKSTARVGLLHDFCLYDFHGNEKPHRFQLLTHPISAVETSNKYFNLSKKENRAILSHMFPLGPIPTSSEAWLVTVADKICAISEFAIGAFAVLRTYFWIIKPILTRI